MIYNNEIPAVDNNSNDMIKNTIVVVVIIMSSMWWNTEIFSLPENTEPPPRVNHSEAFGHHEPVVVVNLL